MRQALVIGGSGLVGSHLIAALSAEPGWRIVSTQRQVPEPVPDGFARVALDLEQPQTVAARLERLSDTTHVFFLARTWRPGYVIEHASNVRALAVLLDAVQDWPRLEHVQLVHGLKWYGSTLGPIATPARETDPRPEQPHFYYDQRELIAQRRSGRRWHFSTVRPHCVSGVSTGSPSNIILGMAVLAVLARARGQPLAFPGTPEAFDAKLTYTGADLLARAMIWAATDPRAQDQDFNVANGDVFTWRQVWPAFAAAFGVETAPASPRTLAIEMPPEAAAWHALAAREGLAEPALERLVDWHFMDASLALRWDQVMSVDKLRRHGFGEAADTPRMILDLLGAYRRLRILPP